MANTTVQAQSMADLQQQYVDRSFGMFLHFNMSTFNGKEYADPNLPVNTFNPTALDTDQWADAAVAAGMTYAILVTKHNDGFALWDTERSAYDVASTAWYAHQPPGQGDIVKRFVDSFRARGISVGLYYSPTDRTNMLVQSSDPSVATQYIKDEITHLLTAYGKIDMLWTDAWDWGPTGKIPNGTTVSPSQYTPPIGYVTADYNAIYSQIKAVSPGTLLVENNQRLALDHTDIAVWERNMTSIPGPNNALPAEVCDTIRKDNLWFNVPAGNGVNGVYTSYGDAAVKTTNYLINQGLHQVNAANAAYLLDVSPNTQGLIPIAQTVRLTQIGNALQNRPNLIANASFESGASDWLLSGSVQVCDDTQNGPTADLGHKVLQFSGNEKPITGVAIQRFAVNEPGDYRLLFSIGSWGDQASGVRPALEVQIWEGGAGTGTLVAQQSFMGELAQYPDPVWSANYLDFSASASEYSLVFRHVATQGPNGVPGYWPDLLVDNVWITPTTAVPEPGSLTALAR